MDYNQHVQHQILQNDKRTQLPFDNIYSNRMGEGDPHNGGIPKESLVFSDTDWNPRPPKPLRLDMPPAGVSDVFNSPTQPSASSYGQFSGSQLDLQESPLIARSTDGFEFQSSQLLTPDLSTDNSTYLSSPGIENNSSYFPLVDGLKENEEPTEYQYFNGLTNLTDKKAYLDKNNNVPKTSNTAFLEYILDSVTNQEDADSVTTLDKKYFDNEFKEEEEVTVDDILRDDPFVELNTLTIQSRGGGPSSGPGGLSENAPFNSDAVSGLGINFNMHSGPTPKSGQNRSHSFSIASASTPSIVDTSGAKYNKSDNDTFKSPKKKSVSSFPARHLISNFKSTPKKSLRKIKSFNNIIPQQSPSGKNQPFSFSECSNTFSINSNTSNSYSFIIENNSISNNSKAKKKPAVKQYPMISESTLEKSLDSAPDNNKQSGGNSLPSLAKKAPSPHILKDMRSGMTLFQLNLGSNSKK